jgi:uncharacterized repeat protein (TIGR04076 family)
MKDVRITVVKKEMDRQLVDKYMQPEQAARTRACSMEIGASFLVSEPVMCPEGLCPWAWHDIESFVRIAAFEGKLAGHVPENSWVRCCTDAFRPVTFLIEPVVGESSSES